MEQGKQKTIININIIEGKFVITEGIGMTSIATYDYNKTLEEIENHNKAFEKKPHRVYEYELKKSSNNIWDWSLLSNDEIETLRELYRQENWSMIMDIHNTKKLSKEYYCCSSYISKIKLAFDEMGF